MKYEYATSIADLTRSAWRVIAVRTQGRAGRDAWRFLVEKYQFETGRDEGQFVSAQAVVDREAVLLGRKAR